MLALLLPLFFNECTRSKIPARMSPAEHAKAHGHPVGKADHCLEKPQTATPFRTKHLKNPWLVYFKLYYVINVVNSLAGLALLLQLVIPNLNIRSGPIGDAREFRITHTVSWLIFFSVPYCVVVLTSFAQTIQALQLVIDVWAR